MGSKGSEPREANPGLADTNKNASKGSTSESRPLAEDPRRVWLELLPVLKRATGIGFFLTAVRAGESTPEAVLAHVRANLASRAKRYGGDSIVSEAVEREPELALFFAAHCIDREKIPRAERERQKAERNAAHAKAWMSEQPPTSKQLSFLQSLGYQGPRPANRALASSWIDTLLKRPGGA